MRRMRRSVGSRRVGSWRGVDLGEEAASSAWRGCGSHAVIERFEEHHGADESRG